MKQNMANEKNKETDRRYEEYTAPGNIQTPGNQRRQS